MKVFDIARAAVVGAVAVVLLTIPKDILYVDPPPESEFPVDLEALQETLDALSDKRLDAAAKENATQDGLKSAGDTCFMRYARLDIRVSRKRRERFALAALYTDPEAKLTHLEAVIAEAPALEYWRGRFEQARIAYRSNDLEKATDYLVQARAVADLPTVCRADEAFYRRCWQKEAKGWAF